MTQKLTHKVKNPNYAEPNHQTWIDIYEIDGNDQVNLHGKLSDPDAVTSSVIASGAITSAALATSAVTSNTISAGAVTSAAIAANAVTSAAIATNAVTSSKIQNGAVTRTTISPNAVVRGTVSPNSITMNRLVLTPTSAATGDNAAYYPAVSLNDTIKVGGSLANNLPSGSYIPIVLNSIGTDDLGDVDLTEKIRNNSIGLSKLITNLSSEDSVKVVGSENSSDSGISIIPSSIGSEDLAEQIIQNKHLKNNEITANKLNTSLKGVLINKMSPEEMQKTSEDFILPIWNDIQADYEPDVSTITPAQRPSESNEENLESDDTPVYSSFSFNAENFECYYNTITKEINITGDLSCLIYIKETTVEDEIETTTVQPIKFDFDSPIDISLSNFNRIFSSNYLSYQLTSDQITETSNEKGLFNNLSDIMLDLIENNENYWSENMTNSTKAQELWDAFQNYELELTGESEILTMDSCLNSFIQIFNEDSILENDDFIEKYSLSNSIIFIKYKSEENLLNSVISEEDYNKIGIWVQI